ncbi:MAG: phosphopyruvate hydratase [Candidatus Komeilibacteria bacterium]|jgi:enolase|nr:phosphopyruvate hydratase [Candidatus Komeilibacteria bacterium]MBT4447855.1 phosphopyruvate hydratase [Candidatus Komeilibacteria bacterium]
MPDKIKKISAIEILDSRGNPTIETTVELSNGISASAAVPSGASTGKFEAHELRDGDKSRYEGKGVLKAIANVNDVLNQELSGLSVTQQVKIDSLMIKLDGTNNKSKLGANAILSVSLAVAHTAAKFNNIELYEHLRSLYNPKLKKYNLPTPVVNVINGGAHASTNINIQEFWLAPEKAKTFSEKLRQASEVFHKLGDLLEVAGHDTDLGNEGGYAPNVKSHKQVFEFIIHAIESSGYKPGKDIFLGIDAGASEFYDEKKKVYNLDLEGKVFTDDELIDFYFDLMELYPLTLVEDPLDQEDWGAWADISKDEFIKTNNIKIIGDDLFVTNIERFKKGIKMGVANTILIKFNQIGTLTETLEVIREARDNDYKVIVSHRSGETSDTTIADLAVAVNADYIKTGSTARGERTVKYNRLLKIEQKLK